jgi:hypothetical protein
MSWFNNSSSLLHWDQAWGNLELTTGACDDVIDGKAFSDFDQSQTIAFVDLEDSLKKFETALHLIFSLIFFSSTLLCPLLHSSTLFNFLPLLCN